MEEAIQQQPQPLATSQDEPGAVVHHPRAIPPELLAQMQQAAMPIQTIQPQVKQGQKDYMPLYVGAGFLTVMALCSTVIVAIVNSPNAQTERVATQSIQASALVAKEVAERPTCRAIGLVVMRGACPDPSANNEPEHPTPQVQPYQAVASNEPLPADMPPPPAPNPWLGSDRAILEAAWMENGCIDPNQNQICADIANAAASTAAQ